MCWLSRLAELGLGACLADDMGLGKTVAVHRSPPHARSRGARPSSSRRPRSARTGPRARVASLRRSYPSSTPARIAIARLEALKDGGAGKVVIASYALLQQDEAALTAVSWGTGGPRRSPVHQEREVAPRRGCVSPDCGSAHRRHRHPGRESPRRSLQHLPLPEPGPARRVGGLQIEPSSSPSSAAGSRTADLTRAIVRRYVLRRLKSDVLADLPPITEVQHEVHLVERRGARATHSSGSRFTTSSSPPMASSRTRSRSSPRSLRLRRFCCHPRLVFPDADTEASKVRIFLDLVAELRDNDSTLARVQSVRGFPGHRARIPRRARHHLRVPGRFHAASGASDARRRLSTRERELFLISLKAGGFGLNLTGADTVIHLDPWWNPAVETQAHRPRPSDWPGASGHRLSPGHPEHQSKRRSSSSTKRSNDSPAHSRGHGSAASSLAKSSCSSSRGMARRINSRNQFSGPKLHPARRRGERGVNQPDVRVRLRKVAPHRHRSPARRPRRTARVASSHLGSLHQDRARHRRVPAARAPRRARRCTA